MKKIVIVITIVFFILLISLFYLKNGIIVNGNNFLETENKKLVFYEFENNLKNNISTICKLNCNGIIEGKIKYLKQSDNYAIKLNGDLGWVEIPFNQVKLQNENGISISFWVNVLTHEKRHNIIYNKGPVGWGSYYAKSISGLYEGDLKKFQAFWTGNNSEQYLNVVCDDGKEISLNKWYFIVHVLEKDQLTLRQYINGKEFCNAKSKSPIDFEIDHNLILGKVIGTYNDTSNIILDNFMIHNYALNENEIDEIFEKGF